MKIPSRFRRFSAAYLVFAPLLLAPLPVSARQPASPHRKVIRNPAEYKAYETALHTKDSAARAAALEAFASQYPRSVVYADALKQEMEAWQQAGNQAKVKQTAKQLLTVDSGNVRALAVVVAFDRFNTARGDRSSLSELCLDATGGMRLVPQWRKPDEMSGSDFNALKSQMNAIFYGADGFCALEQKSYAQARDWLGRAFALDKTSLENAYQLAAADLEAIPPDADGFWYCARAIYLAQGSRDAAAAGVISGYCKDRYVKYHGGVDGWDAVLVAGASQDTLPERFGATIKTAPKNSAATAAK